MRAAEVLTTSMSVESIPFTSAAAPPAQQRRRVGPGAVCINQAEASPSTTAEEMNDFTPADFDSFAVTINKILHCKKRRMMNLPQFLMLKLLGSIRILYLVVKAASRYWKYRGILHAKPNCWNGQAPFIGFYAWPKPIVLMLDLEPIRHILVVNADHLQDRSLYNNVYPHLQDTIISAPGVFERPDWRREATQLTIIKTK
uniref:Uncharacterized protein n=1 Tax=Glossina pallidipes TaxID=7398 RepID=A0A1B0AH77_GLOPL